MIGQTVDFQTDITSYGRGVVTALDELTEIVTVIDEDGAEWTGPIDRIEIAE